MNRQDLLAKELQKEFEKRKSKNPNYSLRAFARDILVSPATLSRILSFKCNLSKTTMLKIIETINLKPEVKQKIIQQDDDSFVHIQKDIDFLPLIENWFYSAIVCLTELEDFDESPEWIAQRLNIKKAEAKRGLEYLMHIGMLSRNPETHKLEAKNISVSSGNPAKSGPDLNALGRLEAVKKHLYRVGNDKGLKDLSDVSSVIQSIDLRKFPEAKNRIKRFRRSLSKYLDSGKKSEVYLMYFQLIPLSYISKQGPSGKR